MNGGMVLAVCEAMPTDTIRLMALLCIAPCLAAACSSSAGEESDTSSSVRAPSPDAGTSSVSEAGATDVEKAPAPSHGSPADPVRRILFVGNSLTHGRYTPVRRYGSGGDSGATGLSNRVVDENFGRTDARAELEPGPWGGIPGIFAQLAVEAGLRWNVHIEAISGASLHTHYAAASSVIARPDWDVVVLQEQSNRPLSQALTKDSSSNPASFCASVQTISKKVHAAAPAARIYLYETWPRGDAAMAASGSTTASGFETRYASNLSRLSDAYHNVYYAAAAHEGLVTAVAPVGDAWARAWAEKVANPNPYTKASSLPVLWYGMNATNDPALSGPDYLHPSVFGAYLSGLVLFQQITGIDVRAFGATEKAASALGISTSVAIALQKVAAESVTEESSAPRNQSVDPCTVTQ